MGRVRGLSWHHGIAAVIAVVGIVFSVLAYVKFRAVDDERIGNVFAQRANSQARAFEYKLADATVSLEALADFLGSQTSVGPRQFHDFAVLARGQDPIARAYWAPLVTLQDRDAFEAAAQQEGLPDYHILDALVTGGTGVAPPRGEYAPVLFDERFQVANQITGLDLLDEPRRREAAEMARDTGEAVATAPVATPDIRTQQLRPLSNFVVYWPVYRSGREVQTVEQRRAALLGYVAGLVQLEGLMKFALADTPNTAVGVSLFLGQGSGDAAAVPAARFRPDTREIEIGGPPLVQPPPGGLRLVRDFKQLGRDWSVAFDYPPSVVTNMRSSQAIANLGLGLVLTGSLVYYVLAEGRRRHLVEVEVAERTRDLQATTEQLRGATEHLRLTTEQMTAIIDSSPIAIIVRDPARNVTIWNRAAESLFGYTASEVIGRATPTSVTPNEEEWNQRFERVERGEVLQGLLTDRRSRDGRPIRTESSLAPFFDATGTLQGTVGIIVDVTERDAAEAARKRVEGLLAEIVGSSNDAMISKTLDGVVTSWNRGAERIFGYAPDEMIGHPISVLAVPGREDDLRAVLDRIKRGDRVDNYETQRRRKDGTIIDISLTVSPIYDAAGQLVGASKVARDISDLVAAQKALRAQQVIHDATFNSAPVGIGFVDRDFRYRHLNETLASLAGRPVGDLLGRSLQEVVPSMWDHIEPILRRVVETGTPENDIETSGRVPADAEQLRYWSASYQPVAIDGEVVGICITVMETTSRKLAEEQQRHLTTQLQQSQKMEAIGQLTGGLAHDFNNLLGVILGNLDFLQQAMEPGTDQWSLTDAAIHAAIRGAELTRQLLAFARRQPLAPKLTDMTAVLEGSAQLLRRTLGDHIMLELDVADGLWPVLIDASQLDSAILNLAVNARDAMPEGGRLTVEAKNVSLDEGAAELNPEAGPGDYVAIAVSDTGTGMPPEVVAKVFEPFFTTKGDKGTGLGLSMVHGFVKQSGGHTRIYSEPGRGTTIRMYFPRGEQAGAEAGSLDGASALIRGNELILVVEDNKGLRDIALRQLQELGYRTIPAPDGAQALEIIRGGTPIDLLFTDVVMPGGVDGRALAEAARRHRPDIKVLYTSGFTAAAASAAMTEAFGFNLLSKPYRKEELGRRIRAVIDGSNGSRS